MQQAELFDVTDPLLAAVCQCPNPCVKCSCIHCPRRTEGPCDACACARCSAPVDWPALDRCAHCAGSLWVAICAECWPADDMTWLCDDCRRLQAGGKLEAVVEDGRITLQVVGGDA